MLSVDSARSVSGARKEMDLMKSTVLLACFVIILTADAQVPQQQPPTGAPVQGGVQPGDIAQINNLLLRLDQSSRTLAADLASLRIDKWKTNSDTKHQVQGNVDSVQRNLATALPELENKVRLAPQDLSANFKLYRNLSALYDVLASVTEAAGAFGPKDQYEPLAQEVGNLDQVRRSLGDRLDQLATAKEMELSRLRNQVRASAQQGQQAPKKIVVDDSEPARKPKKKKPATAPPS